MNSDTPRASGSADLLVFREMIFANSWENYNCQQLVKLSLLAFVAKQLWAFRINVIASIPVFAINQQFGNVSFANISKTQLRTYWKLAFANLLDKSSCYDFRKLCSMTCWKFRLLGFWELQVVDNLGNIIYNDFGTYSLQYFGNISWHMLSRRETPYVMQLYTFKKHLYTFIQHSFAILYHN